LSSGRTLVVGSLIRRLDLRSESTDRGSEMLSVGIEAPEDLIKDFEEALEATSPKG
jgi:O-acetylhomoserine/O-acetylserine sulfhydrylase-like pyridoxal-dependent enzyme